MKNSALFVLFVSHVTLSCLSVHAEESRVDFSDAQQSISTLNGEQVLKVGVDAEDWSLALRNKEVNEIHVRYLSVKDKYPHFFKNWNEVFYQKILLDPEMSYFRERIKIYLFSLTAQVSDTETALAENFSKLLLDEVPQNSIHDRVSAYFHNKNVEDQWKVFRQFLGEKTLTDVQMLVHGGDPFHPTPESLLGKYLAETGAQTIVRKFRTNSDNGPYDGLDRMVVALSSSTLPIYQKYFTKINFFIHYHTPTQGTMIMLFNGKNGTYGRASSATNGIALGSILPHVLLNTREGQRLQQYTKLAEISYRYSSEPWLRSGYALKGGYSSCTHWVGEMPIGDDYVNELKFPGGVDRYADMSVPNKPQIAPISNAWMKNVNVENGIFNYANYPFTKDQFDLLRRVWSTPSRKQFSELLGPEELEAAMRGEYANPGWVAIRLTAFVKTERMPVIFYMVNDATQPLSTDFDPNINAH